MPSVGWRGCLPAEHLKALGIDAFSEAFYSPQEGACLVSKEGPHAPNMTELTLEETAPRSEMRNHQD